MLSRAAVVACLLLLASAAAATKPASDDEDAAAPPDRLLRAVSVGVRGNMERAANWRGYDWGPVLSVHVVSSTETAPTRLKYELEYEYNDSYSKLTSAEGDDVTRVRTHEFRYAKISLLKLRGLDLKEDLRFVPYVAGGVQHADAYELSAGEESRERFWTPTWGAGVEFTLSPKTTLGIDYEQNAEGGDRRIDRISLELKLNVFGDPDE